MLSTLAPVISNFQISLGTNPISPSPAFTPYEGAAFLLPSAIALGLFLSPGRPYVNVRSPSCAFVGVVFFLGPFASFSVTRLTPAGRGRLNKRPTLFGDDSRKVSPKTQKEQEGGAAHRRGAPPFSRARGALAPRGRRGRDTEAGEELHLEHLDFNLVQLERPLQLRLPLVSPETLVAEEDSISGLGRGAGNLFSRFKWKLTSSVPITTRLLSPWSREDTLRRRARTTTGSSPYLRVRLSDSTEEPKLDYSAAVRITLQHQRMKGLLDGLHRAKIPFIYTMMVMPSNQDEEEENQIFEFDLVVGHVGRRAREETCKRRGWSASRTRRPWRPRCRSACRTPRSGGSRRTSSLASRNRSCCRRSRGSARWLMPRRSAASSRSRGTDRR